MNDGTSSFYLCWLSGWDTGDTSILPAVIEFI